MPLQNPTQRTHKDRRRQPQLAASYQQALNLSIKVYRTKDIGSMALVIKVNAKTSGNELDDKTISVIREVVDYKGKPKIIVTDSGKSPNDGVFCIFISLPGNQNKSISMTPSDKAGDLLFTFAHHLTDIIENDILDKGRYLDEPERYAYTVLHKVRNILDACSFLVKNLDGKPHYYDSTFLLLRTSLFDIVSLYFVMDCEKDIPLQKQRIQRIMYDHVKSIWTCAQGDTERDLIKEKFPQCFTDGKFRKDIIKINIIMMLEEIRLTSFRKEVRQAIDLYNIFSKVEHNGILSFNLLHAHYQEQGANNAKSKVYLAAKIIMTGISLLVAGIWHIPLQDTRFKELVRTNNDLKLD